MPRRKTGLFRKEHIMFRATPQEKQELEGRARKAKKSLSRWILQTLLGRELAAPDLKPGGTH